MVSMLTPTRYGSCLPKMFGVMPDDVDRWFDYFFGSDDKSRISHERAWHAPLSVWESNDHFYVEVELPGVGHDDVDVTVEKGTLRIAAERKAPEGERKYWHEERRYGELERTISLPETADPESIEAELREGVLSIKLSKKSDAQPRRISVKGA